MKSTATARINQICCLFIIYLCLLFQASIGAPPCVKTRTASTKRVLPDPACCGLLIAECEQRGLQTVEEDIMLGAPVRPRCENHTCHPNDWWFDHKAAARPVVILVVNQLCEVGGATWQETCFSSLHIGRIRGPNTRKHVWAAAKPKKMIWWRGDFLVDSW